MKYQVWDEINSDESEAESVEADRPEEAARLYAERDTDGLHDGFYTVGRVLCVRFANGPVHRYSVSAEFETTFYAKRIAASD